MARQRYNSTTGEFENDEDVSTTQPVDAGPSIDKSHAGDSFNGDVRTEPIRDDFNAQAEVDKIFKGGSFGAGSTDVANLAAKHPEDRAKFIADLTAQQKLRAGNTPGAASGGSGVQGAYTNYLGTPSAGANQNSELTGLLKSMMEQGTADRDRQAQERAAMREILMGRLGKASEPVSVDSPGIKEMISARQVQSQRGAERQRAVLAERMAAQNLSDSGAMDSGIAGIEQARSESDSGATAQILGGELQSKRAEVMQLLQLATQMGDAESARTLQQQLATLDGQLQMQNMSDVNSRFGQDLGFRKSSFLDDLGARLLMAQITGNQNAYNAFG